MAHAEVGSRTSGRARERLTLIAVLVGVLLFLVLIALTTRTGDASAISGGPSDLDRPPPSQMGSFQAPSELPQPTNLPSDLGPPNPVIQVLAQVVVALLVIAGVAGLGLLIMLVLRAAARRIEPDGIDGESEVAVDHAAIVEHLTASASAIDIDGDVNKAIVQCWQGLEDIAGASGARRLPAQTAREFTVQVLRQAQVPASSLNELADLYEAALFSGDQLPESARQRAIDCLTDLRAGLVAEVGDE